MRCMFAALVAFFSTSAFGNVTKEVCYADKNTCGLYTVSDSGAVVAITVLVPVDISVQQEFEDLGISIYRNYPNEYEKVKAAAGVRETRTTTVAQEEQDLASIPDETWNLFMSTTACVGSVIGCGSAAFTTAQTGGLTLFLTRLSCAAAGVTCTNTYRNWEKYQQKKKEDEERLKKEQEKAKYGGGSPGAGTTPVPEKPIALPPAPPPPPPPPPRNPKVTIDEFDP